MDGAAGSSGRPMIEVFAERATDFDRFRALHSKQELRAEQLSSGPFAGDFLSIRGRLAQVARAEFNQTLLLRGRASPGLCSIYPVSPLNAGGTWRGRRLRPGQLVAVGPEVETDHRSSRRCRIKELSLGAAEFGRLARILLRRDSVPTPRTWTLLEPSPEDGDGLVRAIRSLLLLGEPGAAPRDPDQYLHLEERAVSRFVTLVHPGAHSGDADLALAGRTALARRAEDLMRARLHDPIGTIALCEAVGASERPLRRALLARWALGPIGFYRMLRLNAARAQIKRGAPSVADAARGCGFHHLGHFAADYRRAFGERPSDTGRRTEAGPLTARAAAART